MGAVPGRQSHLQPGALGRGGGIRLASTGWIEADPPANSPLSLARDARAATLPALPADACDTTAKRPHIIMLLDESSFDVTSAPDIKVPAGYTDFFKSADGKRRTMIAESTGGPTWYTEFNVLTGLSARSFGDLKFYVTRIAAGRVTRGLPQALQNCGYKTISLYPTYGDFLGARTFQKAVGVEQFIDMAEMGVNEDMQPDSFYFDQALKAFAREQSQQAPVFMFVYLTANHFPWTDVYRPDLTPPGWTPPGNTAEVDEYIRRQTMTAKDYGEFTARLKRDYPDQSFLVLRFGDHQPAISQKLLEPGIDQKSTGETLDGHAIRDTIPPITPSTASTTGPRTCRRRSIRSMRPISRSCSRKPPASRSIPRSGSRRASCSAATGRSMPAKRARRPAGSTGF